MRKQTNNTCLFSTKALLFYFVLAFLGMPLYAQTNKPDWLDVDIRNLYYPQDSYYTGFSEVSVSQSENYEKAVERAKERALGELSDRVRVMVDTKKTSTDISYSGTNLEEQISSKFSSLVQTTSQTEVVGSKINTYFDSRNSLIYAFAYVSKTELKSYYQNQISLHLNKVEGILNTATELAEKGYKIKARTYCLSAADDLAAIVYAQDLLTAIDDDVTDTTLQQMRAEQLRNDLIQTIADLENSIFLYLECEELVNGQSVIYIADRLPGLLTEQGCGCNFTDVKEEADYILNIDARLSRCQDAPDNIVFCYANATVSLTNTHTGKTLKPRVPETKGGWTDRNKANATEEAFDELSEKIVEGVLPMIKN